MWPGAWIAMVYAPKGWEVSSSKMLSPFSSRYMARVLFGNGQGGVGDLGGKIEEKGMVAVLINKCKGFIHHTSALY
jgi:hypothetical protein